MAMPRTMQTAQCKLRDEMVAPSQPKKVKISESSSLHDKAATTENAKINALSAKLNEVVAEMFEKSGSDIYEWIQSLLNETYDEDDDSDVFSKFLAKFPQIKENVGLIHPAYELFVATRPSTIYNLAEKFREIVPAIISMASRRYNLRITEHQSAEAEYRAGELLATLINDEATVKSQDYGRLVFKANSSELFNILKKKIDAKVTAPAILAVGSFPEMTFYIAVDDVPLKVHGTFADALQSYMKVAWLFNLEYDDNVKAYANFFEMMMGYAKPTTTNGSQLYQKLLKFKDSHKPASTSDVTASMNDIH